MQKAESDKEKAELQAWLDMTPEEK